MRTEVDRPPSTATGPDALIRWLTDRRDRSPVWRDERGVVHVFGYDEVRTVLHDWAAFSSDRSALMPGEDRLASGNLTMMDPPEHRALRAAVGRVFTPRVVATLRGRITAVAEGLLADVPDDRYDLVEHLAHPLPVIVVAELLGVPVADRGLFRDWSAGFGQGRAESVTALHDYLLAHTRARRAAPGDDLISRLLDAGVDGRPLSDERIAALAGLLLLAGHLTTTMLLTSAVEVLLDRPDVWAALRRDPAAVPAAITEVLRLRPPFTQVSRITTGEVRLAGTTLPTGTLVVAWVLSANRDDRVFPDPDRFDVDRPDRQVAFGHGIHFCLGAPLARLEAEVAIRLLLARYRELSGPHEPVAYYEAPVFGARRLVVAGHP
ncbi:cytochrome P450 [Saccharothrix violaceirubra]|uniref:Cytochrome P450 n=1 Tax=Saccharothrix violaceirubra TaxID=413306 RepID=A0A7W7T7F0_9PSEU|nr:cytochrome P450 [Saccharothrix violaceirubra]MBB4966645.1 cytochrome P450 [Saccharothrix violaceirubra]